MYITFEGKDFAGKTTKINELQKSLPRALTVCEPCKNNPELVTLRNIIASGADNPLYKAYLGVAQRTWLHDNVIKPALDITPDRIVISDRCFITSCVYQSRDYKELQLVFEINHHWLSHIGQRCVPDVIVYLEITYDEYLRRKEKVNKDKLRIRFDKVEEELCDEQTFNEFGRRYVYTLNLCEKYLGSIVLINPTNKEILDAIEKAKEKRQLYY